MPPQWCTNHLVHSAWVACCLLSWSKLRLRHLGYSHLGPRSRMKSCARCCLALAHAGQLAAALGTCWWSHTPARPSWAQCAHNLFCVSVVLVCIFSTRPSSSLQMACPGLQLRRSGQHWPGRCTLCCGCPQALPQQPSSKRVAQHACKVRQQQWQCCHTSKQWKMTEQSQRVQLRYLATLALQVQDAGSAGCAVSRHAVPWLV